MKKHHIILLSFSFIALCACSSYSEQNSTESDTTISSTITSEIETTAPSESQFVAEITQKEYTYELLDNPDIRNLMWGMSLEEVKVYETAQISKEETFEAGYDEYGNYFDKHTMLTYDDVIFGDETIDKYKISMSLCCFENEGLTAVTYEINDNKLLEDDGTSIYVMDNEALNAYTDLCNYFVNNFGKSNGENDFDYDGSKIRYWNDKSDKCNIGLVYFDLSFIGEGQTTNVYLSPKFSGNYKSTETKTESTTTTHKQTNPSMGEENALKRAKEYLEYMPFSYDGLIEQLEYEGYTHSEAVYAVDHCGANWNSQASEKAKEYLEYSAFSYSGLVEQLEFEGYSHSDAVDAVDKCGADWNEQAAKKAKQYLDYSSFSRTSLIEQLEFEGFSHSQAVYGVEQNGY